MSAPESKSLVKDVRRLARYGAFIGAILALACHLVPPDYRAVCNAVAKLCTGGH